MFLQLLKLTLFFVGTGFVAGHVVLWLPRRFALPTSKLLLCACGISLSFLACLAPPPLARWTVLLLVVAGLTALLRRGIRSWHWPKTERLAELVPGVVVAGIVLCYGPLGDAVWSPEGGLVYRTGATVGARTAGPPHVLPDSALVAARLAQSGDPFISGLPLATFDPRRGYMGLAHTVSGLDLFVLVGGVFPALWILGSLAVGARLLRMVGSPAGMAFGCFLCGSGFSFLAGLLPLTRSWHYRIWPFLTESTGSPDLISTNEPACLLFLVLAALASWAPGAGEGDSPAPGGAVLLAIGASAVQPALVLPIGVCILIRQCAQGVRSRLTLLGIAMLIAGFFVSPPSLEPLTPMLRALDYSRLELLHEVVVDALGFGRLSNVLRALIYLPVFLLLSLGLRAVVLPRVLIQIGSARERESWTAAAVSSFLLLGLLVGRPSLYWSLGLLLLWVYVSEWTCLVLGERKLAVRCVLVVFFAALSFPSTINYVLHYRSAPIRSLSATDVGLARFLQSSSAPGEVVLQSPNRQRVSLAAHVAHRPTVLSYFGRQGTHEREIVDGRARDVVGFFETADASQALAIVQKYRVRWVLAQRRSRRFREPPWLERVRESKQYVLYRIRR